LQKLPIPGKLRAFHGRRGTNFNQEGDLMIKRWIAFVMFGLGAAAGPMAFHLGDSLLKRAEAEDAPLAESSWVNSDIKVKPVTPTSSQSATWDGYTLSVDRNGAATLHTCVIPSSDNSVSDGKCHFTESVKFLDGVFNFNVIAPSWNTPGLFNAYGINPNISNVSFLDLLPCYQLKCCQVVGDGVDRSSIPTLGVNISCDQACQAGVATNLVVGVSDINTTFGTISFVRGTGDGFVLTANEMQPCTIDDCRSNLTTKFIELSQELARRKLQRLSPRELAQKIEEIEQEIANDEAFSKLDEARKHLKDLMNKHPDSPAAQSAKRMLDADHEMPEATILPLTPVDSLQSTPY
jgi:hypothetical protein